MGIRIFSASASKADNDAYSPSSVVYSTAASCNPDPYDYTIQESAQIGKHLIVKIKYVGCTNYEGVKILLFKNFTLKELRAQSFIDPHFSESAKFKHPFARFEPNAAGWQAAIELSAII